MSDGEVIVVDGVTYESIGRCPCGAEIHANVPEYAIIHEHPTCDAFKELEPADFATYVRRSRGLPEPE
jgi:hypothetical protein